MLKERTKETFEERVEKKLKEKDKAKNKKMKTWKKILIVLLILFILGLSTVGFLLYGPYSGFRDWLITSAMTTLNHQYLATMFYSEETIQNVLANNRVIESNETTDVSLIAINSIEDIVVYENEYEKQILVKDPEHEDYKIINIEGNGYKGYLVAIYDPTKIKVCTTKNLGVSGQYLVRMAQDNNAQLAINGGGFYDPNYNSSGGIPQGTVIQNGKIVSQRNYTRSGGMIGFDGDGKLILGKMTAQEALNMGIQEGVTFGPFLIVNGEPSEVLGNGGWGLAPRTVIGQRADGIVLMLVLDGRTLRYPGADMNHLIEIMQNYGAINAANLDGGTSSALVVDGELINDPIDSDGVHQTRPIATGFYLEQ